MQFSASITAIMATTSMMLATVSSQGTTISSALTTNHFSDIKPGITNTASDASVALAKLASALTSDLYDTKFQDEASKLTVSKPSEIKSFIADVTSLVHEGVWGTATSVSVPAWINALPTNGFGYSAIHADIGAVYGLEPSDAKDLASDFNSLKTSAASAISSLNPSLGAKASSLASSLTSAPASVIGSLKSEASSLTSSLASQISSATHTGAGNAQAQATGGVVVMGAVLGGVLGVAVLL